jgi:hypothetical protein
MVSTHQSIQKKFVSWITLMPPTSQPPFLFLNFTIPKASTKDPRARGHILNLSSRNNSPRFNDKVKLLLSLIYDLNMACFLYLLYDSRLRKLRKTNNSNFLSQLMLIFPKVSFD